MHIRKFSFINYKICAATLSRFAAHLVLVLTFCFYSCSNNESVGKSQHEVLAKVGDNTLRLADILAVNNHFRTAADSIEFIQNFTNEWSEKQYLFQIAEKQIDTDAEIKQRLEAYKQELTWFKYQDQYLKQKLDTFVSAKELESYYHSHKANFELKQNIVKGCMVIFPLDVPKLERIKYLVSAQSEAEISELKSYCVRFSERYMLANKAWVDLGSLVANTPLAEITNNQDLIFSNNFYEIKDDHNIYLLGIHDFKKYDQISPLEYVKPQIEEIIINERKLKILAKLKSDLLLEAKKNNAIEIFIKK